MNDWDEDELEEREQQLRLSRDRRKNGVSKLLENPDCRNFLWELLLYSGVYAQGRSDNPTDMAYRSGRRDMGFIILNEILQANPALYQIMKQENEEGIT